MDPIIKCLFSPWLSQERISIALETKRRNYIYCQYRDKKHDDQLHTAMYNQVTKEALWPDSRPVIAIKMLGVLAVVTTMATIIRLIGHLFKAIFAPLKICYTGFKEAFCGRRTLELIAELIKEIVTRPLKILRVIAYTIPMEVAAFIAVAISPDKGKRLYALLESDL